MNSGDTSETLLVASDVFFNDHPKPLSYGENRSASAVIPPGEGPLGPKETQFRWDGLTSLLARGLDFWW